MRNFYNNRWCDTVLNDTVENFDLLRRPLFYRPDDTL